MQIETVLLALLDWLRRGSWAASMPLSTMTSSSISQNGLRPHEVGLHALREGIYAALFLGLGWFQWHGATAAVIAGLLAAASSARESRRQPEAIDPVAALRGAPMYRNGSASCRRSTRKPDTGPLQSSPGRALFCSGIRRGQGVAFRGRNG